MEFSSALSNPEALYYKTNFLECGGTLCWCLPAILGSGASSVSFERTPELFCSTILCTQDKILIPIEVTHLHYGVRDMQQ